jgi:transposase
MIGAAMITTIQTLWKRYKNKTKIAELTGHDWKTVAKAVKFLESGQEYPITKPHPYLLDPYKEQIIEWIEKEKLTVIRIHEKLQEQGIGVGYSTTKKYVAGIRRNRTIFIRIETKPGEEAQVDFGYVGRTAHNGKKKRTWVFNMRLSYSRYDYYEKVYDQRVETFIQCHLNAFAYFGGVPQYIKIDNLKAAILEANFYAPVYQEMYKTFADYYGFRPVPCRVREPNDKGKVESGIKYVKGNFFLGRTFKDGEDLDRQLRGWLNNTCNTRLHGTIRKIPRDLFEAEEKSQLQPLPAHEFKLATMGTRKAYHDCHIYVDYNYYSVPFEYVGKEVDIELTDTVLRVMYHNKQIALHTRLAGRGSFSTNESHYPAYKRYAGTEYQEQYQVKMAAIGPYSEQLFFMVIKHHPSDWVRTIQGILSLVKHYSAEIVELACKRAVAFDVHDYQIVKTMCGNGSYKLPVEFNHMPGARYEYA